MAEEFQNKKEYGFNEDGCIYGVIRLHEAYVGAELTHEEGLAIESHLRECETCLDRWELLTDSKLEELPSRLGDRQ